MCKHESKYINSRVKCNNVNCKFNIMVTNDQQGTFHYCDILNNTDFGGKPCPFYKPKYMEEIDTVREIADLVNNGKVKSAAVLLYEYKESER